MPRNRSRESESHLDLGRRGEQRAVWFYRLRAYSILERNLRLEEGEIDLVVRRAGTVAFVEVKTRRSTDHGEPYEAVDARKRRRLVAFAEAYLRRLQTQPAAVRFDVISLVWTGRRFLLSHYPDAFRPIADERRPWLWR